MKKSDGFFMMTMIFVSPRMSDEVALWVGGLALLLGAMMKWHEK